MPHEFRQSQVLLNGYHMSAQNGVITMLGFLALPGKGALSTQLEFIYLHTISGWEFLSFMLMPWKYLSHQVAVILPGKGCCWGFKTVSELLYFLFSVSLHIRKLSHKQNIWEQHHEMNRSDFHLCFQMREEIWGGWFSELYIVIISISLGCLPSRVCLIFKKPVRWTWSACICLC